MVSGEIDGEIVEDGIDERFEFTWGGKDECDPAFGSGWFRLKDKNSVEGRIKILMGDISTFSARLVK